MEVSDAMVLMLPEVSDVGEVRIVDQDVKTFVHGEYAVHGDMGR